MATKYLGRTAIEGGRTGWYKNRVDHHERSFRNENRVALHRVDANDADEASLPLLHPKSKRGNQTDKLSPVWRMLDGYVGRPWSKVFAEICAKFDGRTLAGRHVLHDHIMQSIDPHAFVERSWYFRNSYFVDAHGIFRKRQKTRPSWLTRNSLIPMAKAQEVASWLGSRGVLKLYGKLFWAVPTERVYLTHDGGPYYNPTHVQNLRYEIPELGEPERVVWGRGKALSQADIAYFKSLPDWVQTAILVQPGAVTLKRAA